MQQPKKHILQPDKWVKFHADYLFNYTITRVNDHDLAKDMVQETFFSGLKGLKNNINQLTLNTEFLIIILLFLYL